MRPKFFKCLTMSDTVYAVEPLFPVRVVVFNWITSLAPLVSPVLLGCGIGGAL